MNNKHLEPSPFDRQHKLITELALYNLRRWRPFGSATIAIGLILLVVYSVTRILDPGYNNISVYVIVYLSLVTLTGLMWAQAEYTLSKSRQHPEVLAKFDSTITWFLTLFMTGGAMISLLDQKIYASISLYLLTLVVGSFVFLLRGDRMLIPQFISAFILIIGLPSYQSNNDVLIGHYANTFIFLIFARVISSTAYESFTRDFANQMQIEENTLLLTQINSDLVTEIHSREKIQAELKAANQKLTAMSSQDALTGLPNRRRMTEALNEQWEAALCCHHPVTLMMIDIDLFKLYNDNFGHLAGDDCLRQVADVLKNAVGETDALIARYGGEEFMFVASGITRDQAMELGEKIRANVEDLKLSHTFSTVSPYITVSIGINWLIPTFQDLLSDAMSHADQAMYKAKNSGRNRVVMAE